jgi:hypothetical protein
VWGSQLKFQVVILASIFCTLRLANAGEEHSPHHNEPHDHLLCEGFVEKNDLRIPVPKAGQAKVTAMSTEAEFNAAIDKVANVYAPIFSKKGQRLRVKKLWQDAQVNAVAYKEGGYAVVEIWGGLARHSAMNADGVTLVTCHEVGHHLGGPPKYTDQATGTWASVEGQADYFATLKCLRKVFAAEVDTWSGAVDSVAREKCESSFGIGTRGSKLCGRIAMASMASARLSASLSGSGNPSFSSQDNTQVSRTYEKHPAPQCRLDTYLKGDLCRVQDTVELSDSNLDVGVCRNIAGEEYGARARCWFKAATVVTPTPNPDVPNPTPNPDVPNPTPNPLPVPGVAKTPLLNGQTLIVVGNPNQNLIFSWDVSNIAGAGGIYFEVIGPNRDFSVPNGTQPDPSAMPGGSFALVRGSISVNPARQLPGRGEYKFRVIPLDRTGRIPKGRYSNPAILRLQ